MYEVVERDASIAANRKISNVVPVRKVPGRPLVLNKTYIVQDGHACMVFIISLVFIGAYMLSWFFLSLLAKDNSLVDVAWGLGFVMLTWILFVRASHLPFHILVLVLVTIWGLRLTWHVGQRKLGEPEDWRYATWRSAWSRQGRFYFLVRSFFNIFVLQGIILYIVALPIMLVMRANVLWTWTLMAGFVIFLLGLAVEVIADYQLARFIANPDTRGRIMERGLWKYSRHPNYFGELLIWVGIAIIALGAQWGWLAILSPIVMGSVLLKISIPMMEERYAKKSGWVEYRNRTNKFVLGAPRGK